MGLGYSTTVANGFTKTIWVKTEKKPSHFTLRDLGRLDERRDTPERHPTGLVGGVNPEIHWRFAESNNFTPIKIGSYHRFSTERDQAQHAVYITIISKDEVVICNCLPLTKFTSTLIVDKNGIIKEAQPESIWIDTNGKNHRPLPECTIL